MEYQYTDRMVQTIRESITRLRITDEKIHQAIGSGDLDAVLQRSHDLRTAAWDARNRVIRTCCTDATQVYFLIQQIEQYQYALENTNVALPQR